MKIRRKSGRKKNHIDYELDNLKQNYFKTIEDLKKQTTISIANENYAYHQEKRSNFFEDKSNKYKNSMLVAVAHLQHKQSTADALEVLKTALEEYDDSKG